VTPWQIRGADEILGDDLKEIDPGASLPQVCEVNGAKADSDGVARDLPHHDS
jgi:hypothetical protein